ncbi:MAG: RagB/SusD family nutrient uptake outer membrane protein, partial [Prevotella sp.]|nr:RagB/SusD family nutrient uptake outer membrane protein [Prevotella sp.]
MITKIINKYLVAGSLCCGIAAVMTACSDDFLQDKKNYDQVGAEVYNDYDGANGRLNDLYGWCLPTTSEISWKYPSCGLNDLAGKSTEEYAGFSSFVDPQTAMSSDGSTAVSIPDYFMAQANNIQEAVYGRIRNINDFIRGVSGSTLTEAQKNIMLGQAYFFRGWCYYNLFKWYGGVPLVDTVLEPVEGIEVPRASARETFEFVLTDLQNAADMLKAETADGGWKSGADYGRVTSGTALALKGRLLLLWASPLFNRAGDSQRWTTAYEEMKADLATIDACGYGLYQTSSN